MVNHQCGMLSDVVQEQAEIVEDLQPCIININSTTAQQLAAEASIPLDEAAPQLQQPEVLPDLDSEDWMSKLQEGEIFNSPEGPAPRLHGLRRLAKPYIISEESRVNALIVVPREHIKKVQVTNSHGDVMSTNEEIANHHFPMASVTFLITDINGRTFSDSADAYYPNCSNEVGLFPTAVASARAEARTLRKLLGIKQHAAEEITDKDAVEELAPNDDNPVKPEQSRLIDKKLKGLNDFVLKDLLKNITTREIYTVEELTVGEARKAFGVLHDEEKKQKRQKKGAKK